MAMPCWIATCEAHGHQEGTPESVVMLSFRAASQGGFTKLPGFAEMEVRARCSEAAAKRSFRYGVRRKWKWWIESPMSMGPGCVSWDRLGQTMRRGNLNVAVAASMRVQGTLPHQLHLLETSMLLGIYGTQKPCHALLPQISTCRLCKRGLRISEGFGRWWEVGVRGGVMT